MSLPHPSYMRLMNPNAKKGHEPQVIGSGQIVRKRVVQFGIYCNEESNWIFCGVG